MLKVRPKRKKFRQDRLFDSQTQELAFHTGYEGLVRGRIHIGRQRQGRVRVDCDARSNLWFQCQLAASGSIEGRFVDIFRDDRASTP